MLGPNPNPNPVIEFNPYIANYDCNRFNLFSLNIKSLLFRMKCMFKHYKYNKNKSLEVDNGGSET